MSEQYEQQNTNYTMPQKPVNNTPVSLGDWMLTIFLLSLPLVNIILLFVWGFGEQTPISKKNFARASLIWMGIGIILSILFGSAIIALLGGLAAIAY